MRMAARLEAMGVPKYQGLTRRSGGRAKWNGKIRLDEEALSVPYRWKRPRKVFVNSMSDLFHEDLSTSDIEKVWRVMAENPQHQFQILTKRAERLRDASYRLPLLPNVWLGVSVENREQLHRIVSLRRANAQIRFISFEPLLENLGDLQLSGIDWCIVGGESGPGAREMEEAWVNSILRAAREAGTAFHFKQWGGIRKKKTGRTLHDRTYDEYPSFEMTV